MASSGQIDLLERLKGRFFKSVLKSFFKAPIDKFRYIYANMTSRLEFCYPFFHWYEIALHIRM